MAVDPYLIPGTETLKNKADCSDADSLSRFEGDATSIRLYELMIKPVQGNLNLKHLQAIHAFLFQDVYEWAGEIRTIGIDKGFARFEWPERIEASADRIFCGLSDEDHLRGTDRAQFIVRSAYYLNEINILHPFREGNGRAQRAFMDCVADQAGHSFNWGKVNAKEMIDASIHGYAVDTSKLEMVLDKAASGHSKKKHLADENLHSPKVLERKRSPKLKL